ncbi:MAG: TM0106 family RecB-like putative nuclease, partial [Acidimicrobiaceae bacterium]|nr:TM0106 family RecB-like putative nuclease [Acidimicrobiaceae bacterium]
MTDHLLTPSKITAFLDCGHYLTLRHRLEANEISIATPFGSMAQMLMEKGQEHEQACLAHYRAQGKQVFEVPPKERGESFADWVARVGNPVAGDFDVIYQMPFVHDGVRGVADFIERIVDNETGTVRYEPVDAKLARAAAKPGHVLQLCFYAEAIEALTGIAPVDLRIWLGSGRIESVRLANVQAYWRRLRRQLAAVMAADPADVATEPERCTHCQFCEFSAVCEAQWRNDDSLLFVANILKADRQTLVAHGHPTMAALAACDQPVDGLREQRRGRLVTQARLQVQARDSGGIKPPHLLLAAQTDGPPVGFLALPQPDDGDVFLDYEGHPFWQADRGLFFLFGLITKDVSGAWVYDERWAHSVQDEAHATKQLIDYFAERRQQYPGMHVYHYNHTERSSLERLAIEHGVGEAKLAELVETGLFVDLLTVVTNAMQVGVESYGLKHIELLAAYERNHDIDQGAGAVVEYDAYCHDGEASRLTRIARYNEDDVRATLALRDWLLTQRPDDLPWRATVIEQAESAYPDIDAQVEALHLFPADSAEHLLGDLLGYWLRESRAVFGGMISKTAYDLEAQLNDVGMLAGLQFVDVVQRVGVRGNPITPAIELKMPAQAVGRKLTDGASVIFSAGDELFGFSSIAAIDPDAGLVQLTWNERCQELGIHPTAVVLNDWVAPRPKPAAVSELAATVLEGDGSAAPNEAAMAILRRMPPTFAGGHQLPNGGFTDDLEEMQQWVLRLDGTYVAIQGPPGTGKTYTGAHLIHCLVKAGKRVGITAMSHHAIDNLLEEVVAVFTKAGDLSLLHAVRKVDGSHPRPHPSVTYTTSNDPCRRPEFNVVGGTTWLFSRAEMRATPVDVLIVDEAGQLALADALATADAAHGVVLLGDPLQLAQVSKGTHPNGSGASVLEHVLGEHATMPADRGVFLSQTHRMHPDVCGFISDHIYDGRLTSHTSCSVQNTGAGTGLRWLQSQHDGCSTESMAEAELIRDEISRLIGLQWI